MLATIMPFACMGLGLLIGFQKLPQAAYRAVDWVTTISLVILMITIGGNVGTNEEVIAEIGTVGFNCLATCLCAIVGSVLFCLFIEKTVLPLEEYSQMQLDDSEGSARLSVDSDEKKGIDPILILIPVSVLAGAFGCYFFMPKTKVFLLDYALWTSLVILYTSVGIGMGQNKSVFRYIKMVGFKIIYLVLGVWVGSMAGGAVAALLTGMPLKYAVISASGVGYYSMTGATMLSSFGPEAGVYGFMINVFRDFFTVLLLPVLGRVSKSAPIASGAAGNMDSMLVPVTKVVGRELGLVALIVGIVLTFGVPVILPILCSVMA
ncbi:lysine exporter LysO family protein [Emergencia timonensis]|uniref:lysine exporter LysO family protein n=1 Tax=Emergencia timonensis TaxID=1776384 RepID=UPI003995E338